jgi:hypothetical protein
VFIRFQRELWVSKKFFKDLGNDGRILLYNTPDTVKDYFNFDGP